MKPNPQIAVDIIKEHVEHVEHVEHAQGAGYDYACAVTQREPNGAFTLHVRDLDKGTIQSFTVVVVAAPSQS